jgi:hypothetical protein
LVANARDLALLHLERMQREIRADLSNLAAMLKARALAVAGVLVGAVLAGHALATAGAQLTRLPLWGCLGIVAAAFLLPSIYALTRGGPRRESIDLIPDASFAAAKRDVTEVTKNLTD